MEELQTAQDTPQFAFKKRPAKGKFSFRKRPATPPPASDSDSGFTSSDDEQGHRIKRRRNNAAITASSTTGRRREAESTLTKDSSQPAFLNPSDEATKSSTWYDDNDHKVKTLDSKGLLGTTRNNPDSNDGTYKGAAAYQSFIQKNPNALTPKQFGPVKSSTNVRTITVTDYAPDVCKDYKQTGFCGYGDNCKYLHAREDYKHGWELDRDWEIGTKGKKLVGRTLASANRSTNPGEPDNEDDADETLLESIPFACIICKKPYTSPIITKCGHYFCEACALQRYRKNPSCAACGTGTGGVFNVAKKLNRLLEKKRERIRKRKEEAREKGEEVSDDEEDEEGGG